MILQSKYSLLPNMTAYVYMKLNMLEETQNNR